MSNQQPVNQQLSSHIDADDFSAFVEDSLILSQKNRVFAHLATCDDCRELLRLQTRLVQLGAKQEKGVVVPLRLAANAAAAIVLIAGTLWLGAFLHGQANDWQRRGQPVVLNKVAKIVPEKQDHAILPGVAQSNTAQPIDRKQTYRQGQRVQLRTSGRKPSASAIAPARSWSRPGILWEPVLFKSTDRLPEYNFRPIQRAEGAWANARLSKNFSDFSTDSFEVPERSPANTPLIAIHTASGERMIVWHLQSPRISPNAFSF